MRIDSQLIDDTTSWSAFYTRCLHPIVETQKPIVDKLTERDDFITGDALREAERVFVPAHAQWAIIIGGYEHKTKWYQSVRLERPRGVEDEDLLRQLRAWSRTEVKNGKYIRGSMAPKGGFARRSTGWRTPTLEIYSFMPSEKTGRFAALWETYT